MRNLEVSRHGDPMTTVDRALFADQHYNTPRSIRMIECRQTKLRKLVILATWVA
jgi:hypothetical protein